MRQVKKLPRRGGFERLNRSGWFFLLGSIVKRVTFPTRGSFLLLDRTQTFKSKLNNQPKRKALKEDRRL